MKKWEYLRVLGESQKDVDGDGPPGDVSQSQLDDYGGRGWEVVSCCWVQWRGASYLTEVLLKMELVF